MLTPFHSDGSLNLSLMCEHANIMLKNGAQGVTFFGTTGEGASVGLSERAQALSEAIACGIAPDAITLGISTSAVSDAAAQIKQGSDSGITKFLLLPPYYFKGVDDAGLFDWHKALFDVSDPSAKFILYHIPQVTQVPLSFDLIMRLKDAFPDRVFGVKDSAGQWDNTRQLLEGSGLPILVGDERLLHKAAALGAAGSICGMANLYPARMRTIFENHAEDADLSAKVDLILSVPVIPALKQAMVAMTGNPDWQYTRAPLQPLKAEARAAITDRFAVAEDVA